MDTSDRETLRMAVQRLNRLEDKVDDHMAAESDPGVTLEAVPGPRFMACMAPFCTRWPIIPA